MNDLSIRVLYFVVDDPFCLEKLTGIKSFLLRKLTKNRNIHLRYCFLNLRHKGNAQ